MKGKEMSKISIKSQRNMLLVYMLTALVIILLISYGFYWYASRSFANTAYANLQATAMRMAQQLDFQVDQMDFVLRSLLSDRQFVDAVIIRNSSEPNLESERIITNAIHRDSFNRHFYRINYFNRCHDFFTSRFYTRDTVATGNEEIFEAMPWLDYVNDMRPQPFITQSHNDPWLIDQKTPIFSVIRAIRVFGIDAGYLEAQMTIQELSDILFINDNMGINVIALTPTNEILYNGLLDTQEIQHYMPFFDKALNNIVLVENEIVTAYSRLSGIQIMLIQNRDVLFAPFATISRLIFLSGFVILLVAFLHVYIWSKRLVRANELQMQASFDTLQAQINPHFIYNVLNVISSRSFSLGDEVISEICQDISKMLRYSTSTVDKTVDLAQEIAHVGHYLALQKKRYEQRLNYTIEASENLLTLQVPKLILQPFVENAIDHGYNNGKIDININVTVYSSNKNWVFEIRDDGCGFDDNTLIKLKESIRDKNYLQMSIGKMGVINTYARLRIFFGEVHISFGNNPDGGAFVRLEGRIPNV